MSHDPITALLNVGNSVIERVWPDPQQQATAKLELKKLGQAGDLARLAAEVQIISGQLKINEKETGHKSIFISGWRPFVGWVCGFALAYVAIIEPFIRFIALVNDYTGKFPAIDTTITMQVLLGMLGLGAMRTKEKKDGTHKNSLK